MNDYGTNRDSIASELLNVAAWCEDYLARQHSPAVGAELRGLIETLAEIANLSGGSAVDQFERLKHLESAIDRHLIALGDAHQASVHARSALVADQPDRSANDHVLLFVYGTLKRAYGRNHYLSAQKFVGEATTEPKYRLFNCGDYPALVHDSGGRCIEGELWEIDSSCLAILDEVEGVPQNLYRREPISLQFPAEAGEVVAYFYQRSTDGLPDCGVRWE